MKPAASVSGLNIRALAASLQILAQSNAHPNGSWTR
jgi:hypothetical protein